MNHRSLLSLAVPGAVRRPLACSWAAVAAALLIGCGGGGGGGGSSTDGGSTPNDTSWIAAEGWSGSNAITLDASSKSWVAKGLRITSNSTNTLQVRARIPQDLRTIPGEVYIVVPASATVNQTFTQTSSPNAPTSGPRVVFYDYRNFGATGEQIPYNAATQGTYSITVEGITATHVDLRFTATLYNASTNASATDSHTVSGTIRVDTPSG